MVGERARPRARLPVRRDVHGEPQVLEDALGDQLVDLVVLDDEEPAASAARSGGRVPRPRCAVAVAAPRAGPRRARRCSCDSRTGLVSRLPIPALAASSAATSAPLVSSTSAPRRAAGRPLTRQASSSPSMSGMHMSSTTRSKACPRPRPPPAAPARRGRRDDLAPSMPQAASWSLGSAGWSALSSTTRTRGPTRSTWRVSGRRRSGVGRTRSSGTVNQKVAALARARSRRRSRRPSAPRAAGRSPGRARCRRTRRVVEAVGLGEAAGTAAPGPRRDADAGVGHLEAHQDAGRRRPRPRPRGRRATTTSPCSVNFRRCRSG